MEYLLDGANVTAKKVTIKDVGGGLLNRKYKITVQAKLNGTYKEKHFRGVGSEYHTKNEGPIEAEAEFVIETSPEPRVVQIKRINGVEGRRYECLTESARKIIVEDIKKVL